MKYLLPFFFALIFIGCGTQDPEIDPNDVEWEVDNMPPEELDKIIKEMVQEIKDKKK